MTRPSARSRSWVASSTIAPSAARRRSRSVTTRTARSSRPVKGSSSRTSRGRCSKRAFEREPLPHAARKARHVVVAAVGQAGRLERRRYDRCARIDAVQPREERQVLARGQLGIEVQLVREQADSTAQRRTGIAAR